MEHELKCWPEYYAAVESGAKTFELRKADRPFKVGDTLLLREYDPSRKKYSGRMLRREVTYILDLTIPPANITMSRENYVVMGLAYECPPNTLLPEERQEIEAIRNTSWPSLENLTEDTFFLLGLVDRMYPVSTADAGKQATQ